VVAYKERLLYLQKFKPRVRGHLLW